MHISVKNFPPKAFFYCMASADEEFLPFSSLLEADTIFYRAINKTWHFFFHHCNHPVVRHWVVTSMLYHSTWLYSKRTWQRRAALRFHCSPFPTFSLCSPLLCSRLNGGLVKCVIYPCLPPPSGNHTKRGPSPPECNIPLPALPLRS